MPSHWLKFSQSNSGGEGVNLDVWASNMAGDAGEKDEGEPGVPCVGHGPGNWPARAWPMLMAMDTFLACSSATNAADLFAASFISLSALPRVSISRRSTSAAHRALDQPGGLSFGARGFLAFGAPSFFGGMVVNGKRMRRMAMAILKFGGENGDTRRK